MSKTRYYPGISIDTEKKIVKELLSALKAKMSSLLDEIVKQNNVVINFAEYQKLEKQKSQLEKLEELLKPWEILVICINVLDRIKSGKLLSHLNEQIAKQTLDEPQLKQLISSGELIPFYKKINHLADALPYFLIEAEKKWERDSNESSALPTFPSLDEKEYQNNAELEVKAMERIYRTLSDAGLADFKDYSTRMETQKAAIFAKPGDKNYSGFIRLKVQAGYERDATNTVCDILDACVEFKPQLSKESKATQTEPHLLSGHSTFKVPAVVPQVRQIVVKQSGSAKVAVTPVRWHR
jgi:hypothetical protein